MHKSRDSIAQLLKRIIIILLMVVIIIVGYIRFFA